MRVIVQRVSEAKVTVDENIIASIKEGLLLLVGIHETDTNEQLQWMCDKILKLRVFYDDEEKWNKSVTDVKGSILVVSQFTLYGNIKKGTRPSYIEAARPERAEPIYNEMINYFKNKSDLNIQTGRFGAMMNVHLLNNGPVTLILEK